MRKVSKLIQLTALSLMFTYAQADQLIQLNTRPGVTQPVLLWETQNKDPEFLLIFFPSSNGNIGLRLNNGRAEAEKYYLLASQRELFTSPKFAVAIIDTPSDRKGLGESFRQSADHANDMRKVITELKKRFPKSKVVLMGHSRGSVSAGYVSRALKEVDATVLLSARYKVASRPADAPPEAPGGSGLSGIDFSQLKKPTLLVHHVSDACPSTLFSDAQEYSKYAPLIKFDGPKDKEPSMPGEFALCAPGTNHWFSGQEKAVGEKIIEWLAQNKK